MLASFTLIPVFPLVGALLLAALVGRAPRLLVSAIGVGSVLLAFFTTVLAAVRVPTPTLVVLSRWLDVGGIAPSFALRLDDLALWTLGVVTGVGSLVAVAASESMDKDAAYARFMALVNLFVAAMSTLVLADNLLLLFAAWQAVGVCTYLIIGFWWQESANGAAARKAMLLGGIGDAALLVALLLLVQTIGSLDIPTVLALADTTIDPGTRGAITTLLLLGVMAKAGQVPLHTWYRDVMAAPAAGAALIAGLSASAAVYLVLRLQGFFELFAADTGVALAFGTLTLLVAGIAAIAQTDLRRAAAYATVSQLGSLFLTLGAGAWTDAMLRIATHAVTITLLFLATELVIRATSERDLTRLGGLRARLPLAYGLFLVVCVSIAATPLAAGSGLWAADPLWAGVNILGGFIAATYAFRLLFLMFHGEPRSPYAVDDPSRARTKLVLVLLAILAVVGVPVGLATAAPASVGLMVAAALFSIGGAVVAYTMWGRGQHLGTSDLVRGGFGFDAVYDGAIVRPFLYVVGEDRGDFADAPLDGVVATTRWLGDGLAWAENGRIGWAIALIAAGATALVVIVELV